MCLKSLMLDRRCDVKVTRVLENVGNMFKSLMLDVRYGVQVARCAEKN